MNIQDQDFQYLFMDPRNDADHNISPHFQECSVQGTGVMYRLIDNKKFFGISFKDGYPSLLKNDGGCDVTVTMNVANFTSLVTGCVSFRSLVRYGQATLSDDSFLARINNLFITEEAPICMTRF